jgi:hypothetical protein
MIEELITTRNRILDKICDAFKLAPESQNFNEWAYTLRKDTAVVEKFLKSIYWTHFYEQLWLNFEALVESDEKRDIFNDAMTYALDEHPNISEDIHTSMTVWDKNPALEDTEREKCEHPLGCIASKKLAENEYLSQHSFLKKFTKIQSDHRWPKSRTPHHHNPAEVDDAGLPLCEFHNLNKMNSMDFHVFFTGDEL